MLVETALMANLAMWANLPPQPEGGISSLSQEEKLAHLKAWLPTQAVKEKIAMAFKPRPGETDVFVHFWTGERLSYPDCHTEQLLTEEEIELLSEEDPFLDLMNDGWNAALARFSELMSSSLSSNIYSQ